MLCVSLSGTIKSVFEQITIGDMAEVRMDLMEITNQDVIEIFSKPVDLIATCRKGRYSEETRKEFLLLAMASGARWVDLDVETDFLFLEEIKEQARKIGCKLILSYHNLEATPPISILQNIQKQFAELGADLIKIATMGQNVKDVSRILSLYDYSVQTLAISMGQVGRISRVIALFLGAPFTFVVPDNGVSTAPGQLTITEFKRIWENVKNDFAQ